MTKLSPRKLYFLGFVSIFLLLAMTYYLQVYDGFIPCPLCILQRFVLAVMGILFFIGACIRRNKITNFMIGIPALLMTLIGIGLSGRQVWLQHLPPDTNTNCGVSLQYLMRVLPFDQVLAKILQGSTECAQKGWEFLSLSLAHWSLIIFIVLTVFCVFQLKRP